MKLKFYFLSMLMACATLSFVACGDDDDDDVPVKNTEKPTPTPTPTPDPEVKMSTLAEVLAGTDGTVYKVKGTVKKINNAKFGNWIMTDGTNDLTIYGTLDKDGASGNNPLDAWGITEGKVVTVQGARKTYVNEKTSAETIELVDVTVIAVEGGSDPTPTDATVATCAEIIAGADGTVFQVTGTCKSITNAGFGNWILSDATGEITIYGTLDKNGQKSTKESQLNPLSSWGIEEGDLVTVKGAKKTYNQTVELVDVTVVKVEKGSTPPVDDVVVATIEEILNEGTDGTVYQVTGTCSSIKDGTNDIKYGNWYMSDGTNELYIYGTLDINGEKGATPLAGWGIEVGKSVTVKGARKTYTPKSGDPVIELVDVEVLKVG